jgi:hypothetical protein
MADLGLADLGLALLPDNRHTWIGKSCSRATTVIAPARDREATTFG